MSKNFFITMIALFVLSVFIGLIGLLPVAVCCVGEGIAIVGGLTVYFLRELEIID